MRVRVGIRYENLLVHKRVLSNAVLCAFSHDRSMSSNSNITHSLSFYTTLEILLAAYEPGLLTDVITLSKRPCTAQLLTLYHIIQSKQLGSIG